MGLGRKNSTHLSYSCSVQPPCQVLHFVASLGLRRKGLSQWGNKASKISRKASLCPTPNISSFNPGAVSAAGSWLCTSLMWTRLLRTVSKYLQLRKEALCQPFRLSLGICLILPSLPTMRSSPPASPSVTHSFIHPPYRRGHLPWLSWRHLSCFDFLSWQHRAVLFLACLRREDWEMALRPSALLCCGVAVAAAVWPPRFIHEFFLYF